jgi:uncharacterized membrane protein
MTKGRLEAFTDGVIAVIITIMVLGKDFKGKISVAIYVAAIPLAFVHPWIACGLYVLVAAIWLFPDRRFEKLFKGEMT